MIPNQCWAGETPESERKARRTRNDQRPFSHERSSRFHVPVDSWPESKSSMHLSGRSDI
jgi:hypothetical protein